MPNIVGSGARDVVREGAHEVREKLRDDLSRWSRIRRHVSLKPEIGCLACDAMGKIACSACGGSGKSAMVMENGAQEPCVRCDGHGSTTCVECAGAGLIPNTRRKVFLGLIIAGAIAWALVLIQLLGRDLLPEQRAALLERNDHGRSVTIAPGAVQRDAPPSQAPPGRAVPTGQGQAHGPTTHGAFGGQSVPPSPGTQGFAPPGGVSTRGGSAGTSSAPAGYGGYPSGGGNSVPSPPR